VGDFVFIEYNRCYVWVPEWKVCKTTPRIFSAEKTAELFEGTRLFFLKMPLGMVGKLPKVSFEHIKTYKLDLICKNMDGNLYLARAMRYFEVDPARGINESGTDYSGYHIVIASRNTDAGRKLIAHLKQNTRYRNWISTETKKLTEGKDIPLERRVEVLGEVFPVIK